MHLTARLVGQRKLLARLDRLPADAHDALAERISGLAGRLRDRVVAAEPKRTGALARRTKWKLTDRPKRITARVWIAGQAGKAMALEYGAHGAVLVRAHRMRLDHVFGRDVSMSVEVPAHHRHANIGAHRFIRGPLAAMELEILAGIAGAVRQAVER